MNFHNVEIKANCADLNRVEAILLSLGAEYKGLDPQCDTYFNVPNGRLKLREGVVESGNLIQYFREDNATAKGSNIALYKTANSALLKQVLSSSLGIMATVNKKRKIFFIANVKFHLDEVENLGTFVEIEAIDADGTLGAMQLNSQCNYYMEKLGINIDDLLPHSYSDMLLNNTTA